MEKKLDPNLTLIILAEMREPMFKQDNPARLPVEGKLPPFMEDARENSFAVQELQDGNRIFLKPTAMPSTGLEHGGIHWLVVPDLQEGNVPGINKMSGEILSQILKFAGAFGVATLGEENIHEVDIGWHEARNRERKDPKRSPKSITEFHCHITSYVTKSMEEMSPEVIVMSPEIRGELEEATHVLAGEILLNEVLPKVKEEVPEFDQMFAEIRDDRDRQAFRMRNGSDDFANPKLAEAVQAIDSHAEEAYGGIARCFFEFDEENGEFVKQGEFDRYKLLPDEDRRQRINQYIDERPWLSKGANMGLRLMSKWAKTEEEILDREFEKSEKVRGQALTEEEKMGVIKQASKRFWAFNGLTYTAVFSAKKSEDGSVEWRFRFDPKAFSTYGLDISSPFSGKYVTKDPSTHLTQEQLEDVRAREQDIISRVLKNHPEYEIGPGSSK